MEVPTIGIDINRLGPAAQAQVRAALARREKIERTRQKIPAAEFESRLEADFYTAELWPRIITGEIINVEKHKEFILMPAAEYCGIKLHNAVYTPDFFVEYKNGMVEVIEVKSKAVRKLQGSYVYRRRLFIEIYARPNGWAFREVIT